MQGTVIFAVEEPSVEQKRSARRTLLLLSIAELLAISLWFTGTAVLPQVTTLWGQQGSSLAWGAWLTIAVQIGFAAGALCFAFFNIPDVFDPIRVLVISCVAAAAANAAFAVVAAEPLPAILLRGVTGFFLAGVYPVGMKLLAGWFHRSRGLALGIMIGALSVGSAVPHAVNAFATLPWRVVVFSASGFALLAAVIVAVFVRQGPYATPQAPFKPSQILEIVRNRPARLANFGYLGHMWELYSLWGWVAVIFAASAGWSRTGYEIAATAVIAIGIAGCVWAGAISDRLQHEELRLRTAHRAKVTIVAMAGSAACCVGGALAFHQPWVLLALSLVWGVAVIADSAQFSAIISEVSDRSYVGTALTVQTASGFLLTAISIRVTASLADAYGWEVAMASLAIGPLLGIWAMSGLMRDRR